MPVKKTTTKSAPAKPAAKSSVPQHDHAALQAEIAELRKEVAALKGQCHSCCADLAELKSQSKPDSADENSLADKIETLISALKQTAGIKVVRKLNELNL